MPRKRRISKMIGNTREEGLPSDRTTFSRRGVDRGGSASSGPSYSIASAKGYDGSTITTFATFEPIFAVRPKVLQTAYSFISPVDCAILQAGGVIPVLTTELATVFNNTFDIMLDNIAMKYANAQNLNLAVAADWGFYVTEWFNAASSYAFLTSLLNGDGFNEVTTRIAQTGVTFRSRIQTGMDRLQNVPIVPGLWDLILRCVGYFASYSGGDCWLGYPNLTSSSSADFTQTASWNNVLTVAESNLAALQGSTTAESGVIRIVTSEYYGAPPPVPYPGVRVCKALYEQFRLMSTRTQGLSNVFANPATTNGTLGTGSGQLVPLLIPKGSEDDPWWTSLYRIHPFDFVNNDVNANAGMFGLFNEDPTVPSNVVDYVQGNLAVTNFTIPISGLDGFSSPLNENYWAPITSGTPAGASADRRVQNDFTVFNVSIDQLAANTMALMRNIYVDKGRISYPKDCKDVSAMKIRAKM